MNSKKSRTTLVFFATLFCLLFAAPALSQDLAGDALQVGEQRSNTFSYAPYLGGEGTVETSATVQKTFAQTSKDYRVGVFNEVLLNPGNAYVPSKYLTFGGFDRVSIPSGIVLNTEGPSDIYGSYSAARNSGGGNFRGRTVGARLEAVDDHATGTTWGVVGAEIGAYIDKVIPKFGSIGASINLVNNATDGTPEANSFMFGISASVTNNSAADVVEQAVLNVRNLGGNGTGIIPNMYGIKIGEPSAEYGNKVYNNFGLYVGDHSTVGDILRYNIFSIGANSKNYFQGEVHVGGELKISEQCRGSAQMRKGRAVISSTCVHENSAILVTRKASERVAITYSYDDVVDGASFTIVSSEEADESVVSWLVIN